MAGSSLSRPYERLKELEKENSRLRRLVAELSLKKQILRWRASASNIIISERLYAGCSAIGAGRCATLPRSATTKMR